MSKLSGAGVGWTMEVAVRPGKLEGLRKLVPALAVSAKGEAGTLEFGVFLSADGNTCHVQERFVDAKGALAHLQAFGPNFASQFLALVEPTRFVVYGAADADLRAALAGFSPSYHDYLDGFVKAT